MSYVIFTFTFNKNLVKGNVNNLIGKIAIIKKYQEIDLFYFKYYGDWYTKYYSYILYKYIRKN